MEVKVVEYIKGVAKKYSDHIDKYGNYTNVPALKVLINDIAAGFAGEQPFDDRLLQRIKNEKAHEVHYVIHEVFSRGYAMPGDFQWRTDNPIVQKFIHRKHFVNNMQQDYFNGHILEFINRLLLFDSKESWKTIIDFLNRQGFSNEDIAALCANHWNAFYSHQSDHPKKLTRFGEFVIPLLKPTSGFLGFAKSSGVKKVLDEVILKGKDNGTARTSYLIFLFDYYPEGIEDYTDFLLHKGYNNNGVYFNMNVAMELIRRKVPKYDEYIMKALEKGGSNDGRYTILFMLNASMNGKYRQQVVDASEKHMNYFSQQNFAGSYYYEPRLDNKQTLSEAYFDLLYQENQEQAIKRIERFFNESTFLSPVHFKYVDQKFGQQSLPWLIEGLKKDPKNIPDSYETASYYDVLFDVLKKYDIRSYKDIVLDFALNHAGKKSRVLAAGALASIGTEVFADAKTLVTGKTVDHRVTGALTLAAIATPEAEKVLNDAVDEESNDDTRDIMLEALSEKRFSEPYTLGQVREMIALAEKRKKLNKWNEKWLDETKLPKVYWSDGQPLTENDIRFLLYRMKRATGLNSDIEARQALGQMDRNKSQAFAKALLVAFQDSNSDIKLKYYLTLGAILGDDEMMHNLNTLFKKNIADKRGKMAEYVVGALAMVGSDKALRIVEVIYRKFATKKAAISQAARAALDAAATELSITMDELSDRIIPDFDFDGLYKHFSVEGEEYRAFINSDFKLNYFTEDNKVRKSLPSNVSKEIKAEFKEIEKEVNDVIKSQSGRLEKYMIEERRWSVDTWRTFFFNNPIMFVYGMKLLWGVFDKDGALVDSFYCSEDTSLYNVNDEEVTPTDDQFIGILHPIYLTEDQLTAWKDKIYALSMITIFPILDRQLFSVSDEEKESNFTRAFFNKDVPKGADFVNTFLVKQNWLKSTSDGGRTEFTKSYKDGLIKAYPNIDGPAAWYQGGETPAKVYEINFMGKNWQDKVMLKDVPKVFYSEVMSDISSMVNTN